MMTSLHSRYYDLQRHCFIIYIIIQLVLTPTTSSSCPTPCTCNNDDAGIRLDCRQRHLASFINPQDVPGDAYEIDFGVNPISSVNRSSFPSSYRLKRLIMDNCRLKKLEKFYFRNLQTLEYLDLSRNQIQTIESGSFVSQTRLTDLILDYNWISVLPGYVFRGLDLIRLGLRGNNMTALPDELFESSKIAELDLDENHIPVLTQRCLRPLKGILRSISVSRNRRSLVVEEDAFVGHRLTSLTAVGSGITGAAFLNSLDAEKIDLSDNPLGTLTLSNRDSWTELRLRRTNVKTVDLNFISKIGSVTLLDLSQNSIHQIPENLNSYLSRLDSLNLSRNLLDSLSNEVLSGLSGISTLDLSNNRLQWLPESAKEVLGPMEAVNFSGNPFHCNCEMKWLREWIGDSLKNMGVVRCASPIVGNIMNFGPSEFRCRDPVIIQITQSMNVREGEDVMLICSANSDPASEVQWTSPSGGQISNTPTPNKTYYTTSAHWKLLSSRQQTGWYVCKAWNVAGSTVRYTYINVETSTSGPVDLSNLVYPRIPPPIRSTTKTVTTLPPPTTMQLWLPTTRTSELFQSTGTTETTLFGVSTTQTTTELASSSAAPSKKPVITDDLVIATSSESVDSEWASFVTVSTRPPPASSSSGTEHRTNDAMSWQLIVIIVATSVGLALLVFVVVTVIICVYYRRTRRRKYPVNDLSMVYLRFPLNGSLDKTTDSFQNTPSRNTDNLLRQ